MEEAETVETKAAPKKAPRKTDPVTQLLNEVRSEMKSLGDVRVESFPEHRARHYDERARAWNRQYGTDGSYDGLILSLAFEALGSLNAAERRYSLTQLAAAALVAIDKLDGSK